jgi:hypothetical protein
MLLMLLPATSTLNFAGTHLFVPNFATRFRINAGTVVMRALPNDPLTPSTSPNVPPDAGLVPLGLVEPPLLPHGFPEISAVASASTTVAPLASCRKTARCVIEVPV